MSGAITPPVQLTLHLRPREQVRLQDFVAGDNRQLLAQLVQFAEGTGEPFLYLWGAAGSGRSHLLQGCCHQADAAGRSVFYLPLGEIPGLAPEILGGLEQCDLVCLDDLQQVAGDAAWEQALFHLYNRLRDSGRQLLVSADASPAALPLSLPDLASRLAWGLCFQLHPLDEQGLEELLIESARRRDMALGSEVCAYLLKRCPRDPVTLLKLLGELEQRSLQQQRKLTIPFVRELLNESGR